jgi:hypothetical protein
MGDVDATVVTVRVWANPGHRARRIKGDKTKANFVARNGFIEATNGVVTRQRRTQMHHRTIWLGSEHEYLVELLKVPDVGIERTEISVSLGELSSNLESYSAGR